MNKCIITGRIVKNLEIRYTPTNNTAICEFTLATNRPTTRDGEKQADFINCVCYGKTAENLQKYQGKGSLIAVFGAIRRDQWKTEEGEYKSKTYITVNEIEYLSSKSSETINNTPTEKTDSEILKDVMEEKNPFADFGTSIEITDEDLPF